MKKPGRTYILEQDEHLQNLRKIIKRDFFPSAKPQPNQQKQPTIQLSLNDYLSNFKSNQNKVFSELVELDKQKWKDDHWWFDKQNQLLMIENSKIKKNQSQFQNMIESNKNVNGITKAITLQQAKNSIFFNKDSSFGSYLDSQYESAKKVNYQNCRLDSQRQSNQIIKINKVSKVKSQAKNDSDDDEQNNEDVIMTWGQVEGTPLRLKSSDSYRIPETPDKDLILSKLNEKISKQKKEGLSNTNKKSQLLMKIMGSSTPKSSYQKSSYLRNKNGYSSSVREKSVINEPLQDVQKTQKQNLKTKTQKQDIMSGLLNFSRK